MLDPNTFLDPLGWLPDSRTVAGAIIRLPDHTSQALALYTPGAATAVRIVRGTEAIGRVRRGGVLGARFLLYVNRDLRIANLETGEDRLVLERPVNGSFQSVKCARQADTCVVVRSTDNSDIWQMTLPEAAKK